MTGHLLHRTQLQSNTSGREDITMLHGHLLNVITNVIVCTFIGPFTRAQPNNFKLPWTINKSPKAITDLPYCYLELEYVYDSCTQCYTHIFLTHHADNGI